MHIHGGVKHAYSDEEGSNDEERGAYINHMDEYDKDEERGEFFYGFHNFFNKKKKPPEGLHFQIYILCKTVL